MISPVEVSWLLFIMVTELASWQIVTRLCVACGLMFGSPKPLPPTPCLWRQQRNLNHHPLPHRKPIRQEVLITGKEGEGRIEIEGFQEHHHQLLAGAEAIGVALTNST
jgi:hypothetical protein